VKTLDVWGAVVAMRRRFAERGGGGIVRLRIFLYSNKGQYEKAYVYEYIKFMFI
jgi:hypothetical protein